MSTWIRSRIGRIAIDLASDHAPAANYLLHDVQVAVFLPNLEPCPEILTVNMSANVRLSP